MTTFRHEDSELPLPPPPLLSRSERHHLLVEWNDTAAAVAPACLHELFEAQAARTPQAVALVCGEEEVSYGELDRRASRLARRLRALGVGPEVRVAVCLERSAALVAALLGVLKAGGAYVPVDPDYPEERRRYILADSGAALVVDAGWLAAAGPEEGGPSPRPEPENLAYVIYTSGSTGVPKGVALTHRNAVELVAWAVASFTPAELAGVLAATSVCFDLSVFELFVPLSCGGSVILARNALELPELAAARRVSLVNTVPSALSQLLRSGGLPDSVLTVGLAGEPLPGELAARLFAARGEVRLWNLYGPSEDTTYSTACRVEPGDSRPPAIGRPLANRRCHVLDGAGEPVAWGAVGELCLGGAGLARGYLHRPDLTAERFVPDPLGGVGERLYRTGDLARRRADGSLEFLGRADHQVKIRGFRIELGEIESALLRHPEVREAVVVARGEGGGEERRLVAYVAGGEGRELRRFLAEALPAPMVPSLFVVLEALPRTPNGKVDRGALPAPEVRGEGAGTARTPVEEVVAAVWEEVLGVAGVGLHDRFLDLGGHSLLAAQVVSRLRGSLGVDLPLRALLESPTVSALGWRIEEARRQGAGLAVPPLVPQPPGGILPLSFAQQRLWFLDRLQPGSSLYNVPVALDLDGPLDAPALLGALAEAVRRHEPLRTCFPAQEGRPVQVIVPAAPLAVPVVDLGSLDAGSRGAEAERLAAAAARSPFDLAAGPLLRALLLRLGARRHRLLLTLHHIACDGWSLGVLGRELAALYAAFVRREPSPLPALPVRYADFAAWQRHWLQGESLALQVAFWQQRLAGRPALLELPADRPRPARQSFAGAERPWALPPALAAALRGLVRRRGETLFMALLAGLQALLARLSGQEDVLVGAPVANRNRVETEGLVGFFVNLLVLRGDLGGDPSFAELLGRTREAALAAYAHQDLPFELLVEALGDERHLSHGPLLQVVLAVQRRPLPETAAGGLVWSLRELANGTSKFDLTLSLDDDGAGLRGFCEHALSLFDGVTVERLLRHLEAVLAAACEAPGTSLSRLPLLSAGERHQLLAEWSHAEAAYPRQAGLPALFAAQAAAQPAAVAVTGEGVALSYAALNLRANRLANVLLGLGIGRGDRVGVHLERSADAVVALLGILKAGAAYVPIDVAFPAERVAAMLTDAAARLVVTREGPEGSCGGFRRLAPDAAALAGAAVAAEGEDPSLPLGGDDLACVIYTSGSTGQPKGVALPHRGISRLALGTGYLRLGPGDTVSHAANLSFDAATWEIWGTLLSGARLVIVPRDVALSAPAFAARIAAQGITTVFLTTALLNQLAREEPQALRGVRHLLFGGEAADPRWVREALEAGGPGELLHFYGPAENTTYSTWHRVGAVPPGAATVPIGLPVTNSRVLALDGAMQPVPLGATGELYVGGDGLAWGYLGRPEPTAERFLPDPFSPQPGARLYRTGDLARRRPDGALEFLGRADHQVKIRGFRIEPGEVEAALARHPGVREAVVLAREDLPGGRALVAYVTARAESAGLAGELRRHLAQILPDYMVPSAWVFLAGMPLTLNGKVDLRALPAPEGAPREAGRAGARTPEEEVLTAIWEEVLGRGGIAIHDVFFEVGGHSLLATQVLSRVRRALGVELPVQALFAAPTVAGLAACVQQARWRGQGAAAPLVPVPRGGELPLSFAQQRLWFLDQMEPGSPLYNVPVALDLRGPLAAGVLSRALAEIAQRHEALRTRFPAREGRPVQELAAAAPAALPEVDLTGLPAARREGEAGSLSRAEAGRPFDLARGPLLRAALLRLGAGEHRLLLTVHHIACDGWSMGILLSELAALYAAFAKGEGSPLPALAVQYADFAVWQRQWLRGEVLERQLAYWRQRLADAPAALELPADRPRPAVQSFRGGHRPWTLGPELTAALQALGRRQGATLFMTLLAAFQALLGRLAGQRDVLVGSPVANRNRVETEGLIGFFVNTLVLRGDLSADPTFAALLGRVRDSALAAYAHQDLPFERLVEELGIERRLSHGPLLQAMLALQNAPMPEVSLGGLSLRLREVLNGTAKFDLTLSLEDSGAGLRGGCEYAASLFDAATVDRLLGHLATLAAGAAADPEALLSRLPWLSPGERQQLLVEWNDTAAPYPREAGLSRLFALQVRRTPDAVALVDGGEAVRYAALDARANRLAHHLLGLGVGRGERVGVHLERSAEAVTALLAIVKAGAAYVPLDPSHPAERLAGMLADAGVRVLVAGAAALPFDPGSGIAVVRTGDVPSASPQGGPPCETGGGDLAYVIYTSGSTGRPKGVALPHRAVSRLVLGTDYVRLGPGDVVAHVSNLSFDAAIFEVWGALLTGACLAVIPREVTLAPDLFAARLAELGVTALLVTTALFNQLAREAPGALRGIQVLFGGEAVEPRWVRQALAEGAPARLLHVYGPAEGTTLTSWHLVEAVPEGAATVPIGNPIANTCLRVLDGDLEPVPAGVPGELCAGGDGLAWGYLGRPGLTAERFVPDPFGAPGARLYRTGDLVRRRPAGAVEFLGRADLQVKIRGFRIELGEIEAVLARHPAVAAAAVLAREDRPGERRIVAYVVARGEAGDLPGRLRRHLAQSLPDPMQPAAWVFLAALPLTPNGKVDRRALPSPVGRQEELAGEAAPRTPLEEVLAAIWAEVLGVDRVGIHDGFFALGGHSLLATQVLSRVRNAFGVDLPVRSLFEAPTVAGAAERVEQAWRQEAGEAPPLVPARRDRDLPLSFAQQRLWFLDRLEPGSPLYNLPLVLRLRGPLAAGTLRRALEEVVRRHEALRTRFPAPGGSPLQEVESPPAVPLPVHDLDALQPDRRQAAAAALAAEEARRPFDLARGPLLRAALLRLGAEEHRLLLTVHHIACDGWSLEILARELSALLDAFSAGRPSPLPPLPVQYADFALWQRQWLQGEVLGRQLAYWRQRLAGSPAALDLPADRPRPAVQSFRGGQRPWAVAAPLAAALRSLGRQHGATLFMTLLAGFQALLVRSGSQEDVLVGTPVAGRGRLEVEPLIGFFVNTLVLRTDLAGDPPFGELLRRVREDALGAYAHQDLPFEMLVEELRPARSLAHAPLVQVLLTLHASRAGEWRAGERGLALAPLDAGTGMAKFDLTLGAFDGPEGLAAALDYSRDLFDAATAQRLLDHLGRLLAAAVADPAARLSDLPLLGERERAQVLREWNATAVAYPRAGSLPDLFEAQAARTPAAPALTFRGETLSYAELDRRANRLAAELRRRGVGAESRVGVCLERSLELVVACLGILKAGGAYVPLDPEYPRQRLAAMVTDAEISLVLLQERWQDLLPAVAALHLEAGWGAGGDEAPAPPRALSDASAVYVLFTSGSTGRPKGVVNSHGAVRNRLLWMQEAYGLTAADGVLQKTPFSFDVSVWELFWPLLAGARLVMAEPGGHRSGSYLCRAIAAERITTIHFVPSMLAVFLEEEELAACAGLVRVIASGEALPAALERRFFERLGALGVELHNLYGPTEAAIDVTSWRCTPDAARGQVPIGRPIANVQIHLLDRAWRRLGIGLPGELCIGGVALARGYQGRPDLTAEKFIPAPCEPDGAAGERLYRTGDLARWSSDGVLEYLGRLDHQVKLRGLRIELGEIEAVLASHPGVREAVVVLREVRGDRALVGYVVPAGAAAPPAAELREHLRQRLPEHMVPPAFVALAALPLSSNGKVDRRELPAPELGLAAGYAAPRTPVEEVLAAIWSEVLGGERIGLHDSFFDRGGHSLLATRVLSRVRTAFGIDLPVRSLFEAPTLEGLAARIEAAWRQEPADAEPAPAAAARLGELPLSFAQERLWFLDRLEPDSPTYNLPLALRLAGPLDLPALERSLGGLIARHEVLRTCYPSPAGRPAQAVGPALPAVLPVADLSALPAPGAEAARLAAAEARRPFDLERGPVLRALALRLEPREHHLLVTVHHIACDGWSIGVLARELSVLYAGTPLPPLPIQYADFAVWQRQWLQGPVLERQLGYWRQRLAGGPTRLELPADRPRPAAPSFRGAQRRWALSGEIAAALRAQARRSSATLFMALLAGFQALLARLSGQEDVLVGSPVANRNRVATEGLIGFFANTLVLRGDLAGGPSFAALLARTREEALGAYAHQDLPFERLVEELGVERQLSHGPLVQAMLAFQAAPPAPCLPGLAVEALDVDPGVAKLDLTFSLEEGEGGLAVVCEYAADLFDAATAARWLSHFETLLSGAAASTETPLPALPLLGGQERHQLLAEWNDTPAAVAPALLHELFAAQAARTPEAPAIVCGGESLTYAELDRRANGYAWYLRGRGAGPETRIAISMQRSAGLLAALLGVLKAGGAYVPIDPSYPEELRAYMLADSGAAAVLDDSLPPMAAAAAPPPVSLAPGNLAYVLYTSGSTGRPKGVQVPHGALVNFLASMLREPGLGARDTLLAVTTLAFDIAGLELFLPLLVGARVVLAGRDDVQDGARLAALAASSGATVLQATPATWQMLLDSGWPGGGRLRALCGGEALPRELAERLLPRTAVLWNLYGPTEATIWCAAERVRPDERKVTIGRPIANTRLHVLDADLSLALQGTVGELAIGGEGLARGYAGRSDLTAERFVPDPFGRGERLYRTGDLARALPDGRLEVLGRADHQVKVRGFRIEPGEIEEALLRHPLVREAVVVVRADAGAEERRLVAYVAGGEGEELRRFLEASLPAYMVPSLFVMLEALPRLLNRKVDRSALPAPQLRGTGSGGARTPVEEVVAGVWEEVLEVTGVGPHDRFFDLGGHSLLATQVVSRLRQSLGVDLPLRTLFEAPTVSSLASRIEELRRQGMGLTVPPLVPQRRGGALPLSFAQQRLWFLDRLKPGSPFYNVFLPLRLAGGLDAAVLARALTEVVRRHEALRTRFEAADGAPVQVVGPACPVPLPLADLAALAAADRESELRRLAAEAGRLPFDLARGPLLRCNLVRLDAAEHGLLLCIHHVVCDGWSMGVLLRELAALYAAFAAGGPSPLAELPVQLADYAAWQRSWLRGEELEAQLAYWRRQLSAVPVLELPADRPRPAVQSFRGRRRPFAIGAAPAAELRRLARREGVTPFMLLLAAFFVLLHRHTGQSDLAVGTPIAGRNQPTLEGLIGFFANTLVLRAGLSGAAAFRELLAAVREAALAAYDHQDVPFEKLVAELQPERNLSHSPLFQVLFALQNAPLGDFRLGSAAAAPLAIETVTAQFDLMLALQEDGEGWEGVVEAAADLFTAATADRFAEHYRNLLAGIAAAPEGRLAELPLLSPLERQQLLREWAGVPAPYPADALIHELFAAQAARTPRAVALVCGGERVAYADLDARADRLAATLCELGIGPEERVGICSERSVGLIVGLLAILKAGGAYLPLDLDFPEERLRLLLQDAGVTVVLAGRNAAGRLPQHAARVVELEDQPQERPGHRPAPRGGVAPDNLAYVMYTSGSTGRPKGVSVRHRSVVRLCREGGFARFDAREVFLQAAPVSFDASTLEIWACLLNGGRLVLPPPGALSLEQLGRAVREHGVTTLWLTAGLFHLMADERLQDLAGVRQLLAGGDVLSVPHVERVLAELPQCRLINGYGPTENTTFTCCHPVERESGAAGSVPIGRPVNATRVYIVDRELAPVPAGVAGELLTGGAGLARGYLGRPGLTAERFVPDPHGGEPGERLYRTGDLCRYLPDGTVELLGRIDQQVKIRGFRIEPGEVEAALRQHPDVREAAVVAGADRSGDRRLVAYVAGDVDADALRRSLRGRLPEHMVPAAFVLLPALPLTPNGKLDRQALPAPAGEEGDSASAYVAPRTPVEELVAGIWAELLRVRRAGVHDGFFALGGHSLLAARAVARVLAVFGVELPLVELFSAPTVGEVAAWIERAWDGERTGARPPLVAVPRSAPLPLSFAQERFWFLDRLDRANPAYNVPGAYLLHGPLDAGALRCSLGEAVRRHEVLRTSFSSLDGLPVQRIAAPAPVPLPVVDLGALPLQARRQEARRAGREIFREAFDLARGPLLRARLLRFAAGEHLLLLTLHHAACDAWSMDLLRRELAEVYRAFSRREPSPLPDLDLQYADFAVWQRRWLTGEVLEGQLGYWRQRLRGVPVLELPTDRPRPPVHTARGGRLAFLLPPAAGEALEGAGRRQGATLFMTLLAGFGVFLQRYTGQDDLAVGSPVGNRGRSELETMMGVFLNTLVLRLDLAGDPTFGQLLARVREVCLGAYAHAELPFEKLVGELRPERDVSRTPLFQVLFSLQRSPVPEPAGEPVLVPVEMETGITPFDLISGFLPVSEGIAGVLEHNADLFDRVTALRMAGHLQTLLAAAAAGAAHPLSALPLLTASERHQIGTEWNATAVEEPADTIPEMFAAPAARTPGAVAVVCGTQRLTYGELAARSARLAGWLRSQGVRPEVRVGLCLERSPEMIVGLLGILAAGGVYVPLDPSHPAERLAWILEDAGVAMALVREGSGQSLPAGLRRVALDTGWEDTLAAPPLSGGPLPDNLAYVIYTSGSTGRPKGVAVSHRGIASTLRWRCATLALGEGDRILQNIPATFDPSLWQIFGALLSGAQLVLVRPGGERDLPYLSRLLAEHRITFTDFTPSMLQTFLDEGGGTGCASLRGLFAGGEAMPRPLHDLALASLPGALYNIYGPTEACIDTTVWRCRQGGAGSPVPIGLPIHNKRVHLLDRALRPVPLGAVGELCIGGVGLARGYLGQPGLTAERFIPDPGAAADGGGSRLYRTGDLARRGPDGVLEFLGRVDQQVKIRGVRIEPGEVEAALLGVPSVRACAVLVWGGGEDRRLVAYVAQAAANGTAAASPAELRAHLAARLPPALVPAAFVLLDELPRTPSGKVDRQALPAPGAGAAAQAAFVAPRNALESSLAGVWQQVLGLDRVGVEDNFFELGGHSLLLIRLHGRLGEALGREVSIVDLLTYPSVGALAQHLSRGTGEVAALEQVRSKAGRQAEAMQRRRQALRAQKEER